MSYLRQRVLPSAYTSKNDLNYSAVGITDGGCTISVYKDGLLYLFPAISPSIASCIISVPKEKHILDISKQSEICMNQSDCYLIKCTDEIKPSIDHNETSNTTKTDKKSIKYSKFLFSNQFHALAGPFTFCLFSLETSEGKCILNIDLFQIYNKIFKCCQEDISEISTDVLISFDILCYRHSVDYLDDKYHLIDIITSFRYLKPAFIRIYFNDSHYFIDCKCSFEFNQYLLNLYMEYRKYPLEVDESEIFNPIYINEKDPMSLDFEDDDTSDIFSYPSSCCVSYKDRYDRLLNLAMTFPFINVNELFDLNSIDLTEDFEFDFAVFTALPLSTKLFCIITLSYNCCGYFVYKDEFIMTFHSSYSPRVSCSHVEFLLLPWRNQMPLLVYSHPHVEMFSFLYSDRFFIVTNSEYYESDDIIEGPILPFNNHWSRNWYVKYYYMDPVESYTSTFGTFSGEPCENYFICNWANNLSHNISVYDNDVDDDDNPIDLILNTSHFKGLSQFVWVPNYNYIVGITGSTGDLVFIVPCTISNWAQMIPDFRHIYNNIEYIEDECDFDYNRYTIYWIDPEYVPYDYWFEPWEPVSYKLGISEYGFYDLSYVFSRSMKTSRDVYVDDEEIHAVTLEN